MLEENETLNMSSILWDSEYKADRFSILSHLSMMERHEADFLEERDTTQWRTEMEF